MKRRIGAWAGTAALAVHLVFAVAPVVSIKSALAALPGATVALVSCISYGNTNDVGKGGEGTGGAPSRTVCMAEALAGGLVPAVATEVAALPDYEILSLNFPDDERPRGRQPLRRLSRAPPYSA